MQTRHVRKLISGVLGLIVVGCLWFYFAPASIGGSTTYVVTDGVSMQPRFHTGDLAIVRSQSSYHVGEIVAYYNNMLHTVVLHRIIGRAGSRYLFKGDNNNFVDFEHPARSQLIGSLWIHVPGAGAKLKSIRSPALVGLLVAVGMLLLTGAAFTRRRRRQRRERRGQATGAGLPSVAHQLRPSFLAEPAPGVLATGIVLLLPFVMLALLAFTRPSTALRPFQISYRQSGRLDYSAAASPGPAYAGDRAVTGDPLFTHVLDKVNVSFAYRFSTAAKHSLTGKAALYATIASSSGWQTTQPLGPPEYFRGDRTTVRATLDLPSLLALMRSVQSTTRVSGDYTLTVTPRVTTSGSLDLAPLQNSFSPKIEFSLSELELEPAAPSGAASAPTPQSIASQFAPSASGAATGHRYEPQFLSFKLVRVSVAHARTISLAAIAIVVGAVLALLALLRTRLGPQDEGARIRARYDRLIIPVARVWELPGVPVIDVADIDALVRIAEHYDRSILCETAEQGEVFWVSDESGRYRYAVGTPVPAPEVEIAPQIATMPVVAAAAAPVEQPLEEVAGAVYADELELGGAIAAFQAHEPAEPAVAEDWAAHDLIEAITLERRNWRAAEDRAIADPGPTRAGAFARISGLELKPDS